MKTILYSYFRSSCSYRVRIALNLKKIPYEIFPVDLLKGEASSEEYKKINPKGEVPTLLIDGKILTQSLPIIEYLDERHPSTLRLLPDDPFQRYQARKISEIIASGIQPFQNISVLKRVSREKRTEWVQYYIQTGLNAVEKALKESAGKYCVANQPSMADCCLIPQLYHARRWKIDLQMYPLMTAVAKSSMELDAFQIAHPYRQPDCPEDEKSFSLASLIDF